MEVARPRFDLRYPKTHKYVAVFANISSGNAILGSFSFGSLTMRLGALFDNFQDRPFAGACRDRG